jgi:hypothetical protein
LPPPQGDKKPDRRFLLVVQVGLSVSLTAGRDRLAERSLMSTAFQKKFQVPHFSASFLIQKTAKNPVKVAKYPISSFFEKTLIFSFFVQQNLPL